ncbi:MAG: CarD family transcriptional regulator [Deltaproteobacteria bacterium]|nr:MAG: CarD family transcriptional regulator [Deltaproteobacteria bacterium]
MTSPFSVGDKAVYPVHGVAEVVDIEQREIGGTKHDVYILKILDTGMKIMVPCANAETVGLREIISESEVAEVYEILRDPDVLPDTQTWNRRYREYMDKIKTGSCFEIAEVVRDLRRLGGHKDLSFGERRMLETAQGLLVRELALAQQVSEVEVEREIESIFTAAAA